MKRAIALAGGGTKGAYQAGFVKAIQELGIQYDIVTGTSIGSLNGALLVQHEEDRLIDLWEHMEMNRVLAEDMPIKLNVDEFLKESNRVASFFKKYVKEQGADITPFKEMIHEYYNEEKFMKSSIQYGLVTVEFPTLKYRYITKDDMKEGKGEKFLLASASCFPAFPRCIFDGCEFVDGGYYDNLPIELALRLGADEIIAVDLDDKPIHRQFVNKPSIIYIHPSFSLGSFLDFDPKRITQNILLGYFDTMKAFRKLDGIRYAFYPEENVPQMFQDFYLRLLIFDHKLTKLMLISDEDAVSTKLCRESQRAFLSIREMNFAMIDSIMVMLQMSPYELYHLNQVIDTIQKEFEPAFSKDFEVLPELNVKEIIKTLETMNKKEIVMKLIYCLLYPEASKIPLRLIINVFGYETAMALWIITSKGIELEWKEM
ncbi:patatin-like phospholipase family protein [Anaerorhabdus furcosa]|uniref:Patatin-like phospholipase n=1 Tax=Anaerorhabdus furcosa TaxID=118967 RepID=A0A1T4JXT0_9FIRM|nr:patatin-like phospholipase family protein [Anaerorhabdus furcosa]SJZ34897.1 Patatin-like phospholipase [Anaerorhabdus furcosa]